MRALAIQISFCALLLSCRSGSDAVPAPVLPPQLASHDRPAVDGNRRLDRSVVPLRYELALEIDPRSERFSGRSTLEIDVTRPSASIRMHAADMVIGSALVEVGDATVPAETITGANGALELKFPSPIPVGRALLHFDWEAPLPQAPFGLYRVEDRGQWFAFTQFEPLEARKAFPSFDQPEFKTPYAVTLRVPTGFEALGNGPEIEHRSEGDFEIYRFAETKPLPTYLVAFAVGNFDRVPVSVSGAEPPTRIIATRGKGSLVDYSAHRTPVILDWLVDYFAHPHPFAKLDLIAVPNFGAGAMENVGLVTFREPFLLLDGERAPVWERRTSQSIIAHELAHMWYGNLVTMAWWDDLWLNESFATWMAAKVLADIDPALESRLDEVSHAQYIMYLDSKRDARRIRQPIVDGGDIYNAFDGITYGKGAAVLRMVEAWIGEEPFRDGVRSYMREHAYGTGGTDELLEALTLASGKAVAESVELFLDQPGAPLIRAELRCDKGEAPRVALSQTRFLPRGSDARPGEPWRVPMCVAYDAAAGERAEECFVLSGAEQELPLGGLEQASTCPSWLHPNADERGYYHWSLSDESLEALVTEHLQALTIAERVGLPGHLSALLETGSLSVELYLDALLALARDPHRKVQQAVANGLQRTAHTGVLDDEVQLAFAAFTRELLDPAITRVGLEPKAEETPDAGLLRAAIVPVLADPGEHAEIHSKARDVAVRFLAEPDEISEETLSLYLPIAAWRGDEALWAQLLTAVNTAQSPGVRTTVIRTLGSFRDPDLLRKSLDLVVEGRVRAQDYRTMVYAVGPHATSVAWSWLTENYATLAGKLGPMTASRLPALAAGLCDSDEQRRVEEFFSGLEDAAPGTERSVRLALEDIERCARLRETIRKPIRVYLEDRADLEEARRAEAARNEIGGGGGWPPPPPLEAGRGGRLG